MCPPKAVKQNVQTLADAPPAPLEAPKAADPVEAITKREAAQDIVDKDRGVKGFRRVNKPILAGLKFN